MFNKAVVLAFKSENCHDQLNKVHVGFLKFLEILSGMRNWSISYSDSY